MKLPRSVSLEPMAVGSLQQIIGIMTDHMWTPDYAGQWDLEHIIELEERISEGASGDPVTLGIDDVALLLEGMAFTEIMSMEFPWIDMVRWASDFVTAELRQYWTDEEWREYVGRDV